MQINNSLFIPSATVILHFRTGKQGIGRIQGLWNETDS
jgi:hypothetical protein